MKRILFRIGKIAIIGIFIIFVFNACTDDNSYLKQQQLYAKEQATLQQYIKDHNITVAPTSDGLYYIETLKGTGERASYGRTISVNYEGRFLNDTVFDSSKGVPFEFTVGYGQVITGWDEAVQLMRDGGKARLIVPSTIAYGNYGSGIIPPFTTLIFDIEITNVQ
jgi:FKBP-type peptidyl-prolyl cis-trans isomerase